MAASPAPEVVDVEELKAFQLVLATRSEESATRHSFRREGGSRTLSAASIGVGNGYIWGIWRDLVDLPNNKVVAEAVDTWIACVEFIEQALVAVAAH